MKHPIWHCAALGVCLISSLARGENWPQFRGPDRQGHSSETGLPVKWGESDNIAWKVEIPGDSWSSPIVWDDRVFLTTATDGGVSCRVIAIDRRSGAIQWNKEIFRQVPGHKQQKNSYATPTPVTDGKRVYALFGDGSFAAISCDGTIEWTNRDIKFYGEHGLGASPMLYHDLLITPFDGSSPGPDTKLGWQIPWDQAFLLALDVVSGKQRWRGTRGQSRIAHVSPILARVDNHDELISAAGDAIQGFDPLTGERLWNVFSAGEGVVPTPVIGDGLLFTASGFGATTLRAVRLGGAGDVTKTHIAWEQRKGTPHMASLLFHESRLYTVDDGGVATCYRSATGEVVWQKRLGGAFSASPVLADGHIYLLSEAGETTVIQPGDKPEILSQNPLGGKCQASMAVSHGQLFVRTDKSLYCIGKQP